MSEGHSVLFEQDQMYQSQRPSGTYGLSGGNTEELEYYQTNYQESFSRDGYGINQAPVLDSRDDFLLSSYGENRMIEISWLSAFGTGGFPDEPPLLEELGVNFNHIKSKTMAVLNPFRRINTDIYQDSDMAGPLLFIVALGTFMLLSGKLQFGYIYGIALMGWIGVYALLNLMSKNGIDLTLTASILGYCLLPIVILAGINIIFQMSGNFKFLVAIIPIIWATYSSSTMFVAVLAMTDQKFLVAYPITIFYTSFVMMTIS
ncbi:hypothetical protein BB558_004028 [Smittium angustum]|uniref:Protein YIP n=1 Tax=Smittium angustum TaxID=133377 RepID=A0A2U1IZN1_SMIAN|nr:hypothetical protein BB558_005723 [Smittium angustum]PVZ99938.1 hypothetical protein BB558_004028 [Smittium angustum]